MTIITLLTDFGLEDGFVGVMKGIILGITPQAQIADISHAVRAQDVLEGALVVGRLGPYFPPGTLHVAVVDPGVGTARRPIAVQAGGQVYIGPDNGLFSVVYQQSEDRGEAFQAVHLDRPACWRSEISNVFHGRDIFAPVAAHLANGVELLEVGTPIADPQRLALPGVEAIPGGLRGQVILIDHFGNLLTNLFRPHLQALAAAKYGEHAAQNLPALPWRIRLSARLGARLGDTIIDGLQLTFGSRPHGELAAVLGEVDDLTLAVVNGSAQQRLGAQVGDLVEVLLD
jgi:hypothetical protein